MKDIIIILLMIILFIVIFYLLLLKRGLKKLNKDLTNKLKNNSNILLMTDISDKNLCQLVDTINNALKEYNDIKNIYEVKNNNLQKMMINISHDLRTPLTSALGYIDIILKSKTVHNEEQKNLLIIEERLKRLSDLIDSFFEFSKIISNNQQIELTTINLIAVLEKSISNHYEDFSNDNRIINLKTDNRNIIVQSNEAMLIRIFDNLIGNAYKHSTSNLDIEVEIKNQIRIYFMNDLKYKDLDTTRIFDEFYTVDISRTKGNTGLGLAIAKEFVEQLSGVIKARKKNNKLIIIIEFTKY